MLDFSNLDYTAIVVATLINIGVGAFWYSPLGFGKLWTKLTNIDMKDMKKSVANQALGLTIASGIIQSVLLTVVVHSLGLTTAGDGIALGLVLWAGFVAATTVSDALYTRRSWKLWALNSAFYLLVIPVNGAIFAVW